MSIEDLDLLTVKQVAQRLNCSARHVWRLIAAGSLSAIRLGGLTRVSQAALSNFIAASKTGS